MLLQITINLDTLHNFTETTTAARREAIADTLHDYANQIAQDEPFVNRLSTADGFQVGVAQVIDIKTQQED
tara:strand:- start:532 stop:744 length:213 start_codon:yes stop_codon:yes gene_type:complete